MNHLCFLADVHISPLTVMILVTEGYDIIRTTDLLPQNASDSEILELARVKSKVVLTQDLDFSMLVALSNYGLPSLITLRLSFAEPDRVAQRLLDILPTVEMELTAGAAITVVDILPGLKARGFPVCPH
ncbi:MAG: hypothetical protein EA366_05040 [Spirulina sp. DLM2.Bin59]|nr:MAG: hypothetical protein EA366_05040 [Spirulina sp. DLM2.Bin59]